ncbi:uncharacterized protein LOC115318788 isoform X2 [Ixodes scapularis]|uniref:uncharacterized protein LOC115318788 isoform X2 n=1 Tax=Ixodes scapularis TaxID=6945 RepID=UPI001A9D8070|nr:uncharacterized protein LOC115318788 isoform X2 [Ixodes scapularis]
MCWIGLLMQGTVMIQRTDQMTHGTLTAGQSQMTQVAVTATPAPMWTMSQLRTAVTRTWRRGLLLVTLAMRPPQIDDSDCVKVPLHKERKFIVFEGCLLERFKVCRKCHAPCCNTTDVVGTLLIVNRRHGGASQRCMSSRTLSFCKVSEARALPLLGWTLRFARIQCRVLHLQVPQGSHLEGHPC